MRNKIIPFCLAVLLAASFAACKKSEQTTAPTSEPKRSADTPPPASEAKRSADSTPTSSDKAVLLKVQWPVGNRYVYRMDLDQHSTNKMPQLPQPMQQNVTMAMTYALSVLKETPSGGRELEMEFLANEMEVKMGQQVVMSFDSKENSPGDAQNPFTAPYRKMIGSKLRMQMDADGKVEKIIGLEEWVENVTADAAGPGRGMISQQFNEGYFRQIVDFGRKLVSKAVQVGDTWPFQVEVLGDHAPARALRIAAYVVQPRIEPDDFFHLAVGIHLDA
jgi:hypothetical protein